MSSLNRSDMILPPVERCAEFQWNEAPEAAVAQDSTDIGQIGDALAVSATKFRSDRSYATHSLFETSAWLDAVAPNSWDIAEVHNGEGIIARMPYVLRSRVGVRVLTVPPLTPWLGPWIAPGPGKYQTRLSREHELLEGLLRALPPFDAAVVPAAPEQTNMLPFHWGGFKLCTSYTYRIPLNDPIEMIAAGAKQETRKTIKKARERLEIVSADGSDEVERLLKATYHRQNLAPPALIGTIERILSKPELRPHRELLLARDERDRTHAFALIVFDSRHCFYVIGGADPERRASGAQTLLLWTAIERSKERSAIFDFEGSMKCEIERAFRAFGAIQTPRIVAYAERSLRGTAYRVATNLMAGAVQRVS